MLTSAGRGSSLAVFVVFVSFFCFLSLLLQQSHAQTPRCDVNGKIRLSENRIDRSVKKFIWLNNSLGEVEAIFVLTTGRTVYRSMDQGQTFEDLKPRITTPIDDIVVTANYKKLYFVGDMLWTTDDQGDHVKASSPALRFRSVKAHPTQPDWALAQVISPACSPIPHPGCSWDLYLTQTFGASWEKKASYVAEDQFDWGDAGLDGVPIGNVYFINYPSAVPTDNQASLSLNRYAQSFQSTPDLFKTYGAARPHAIAFKFYAGAILVAEAPSSGDPNLLKLFASHDDGKTFGESLFPTTLFQRSYHIADLSEGTAIVSVDHVGGGPWATTYISDNLVTKFSTISNYTRRSLSTGKTDIKRISALEGIYFINRYALANENDPINEDSPLTSAVTFDKGGEWQPLQPPARDLQGNTPCSGCSIHLVPFSSTRRGAKSIYSKADTPGLLLATGSVGTALVDRPDKINTYLSRDAGMTWSQLTAGEHTYEVADFGSLIILAKTNGATSNIRYTWDQGLSSVECAFASVPIEVREIYNSPSGKDMSFIIYGTAGATTYLIHVDFTRAEVRECKDGQNSDYESWSPSDVLNDQCLLGQRTTYTRRKQDAACYNPKNYQRPSNDVKPCACAREDLQCDYCYEPDKEDPTRCIVASDCPTDPLAAPSPCVGSYNRSQGYRLVPGDKCLVSQADASFTERAPKTIPCKGDGGDGGDGGKKGNGGGGLSGGAIFGILVLVFFVLLAIVVVIGFVLYRVNPEFRDYVNNLPLPSASSLFGGDKAYKGTGSHEYASLNTSEPQSLLDDLEADENTGLDELLDDEPNELDDKSISTFTNQKNTPTGAKDPLSGGGDGGSTSIL